MPDPTPSEGGEANWSGPMSQKQAKEVLIPPLYAIWWVWWKVVRRAH